jgi:sulfate adenylyltransferase subunit 1 (EFTu-like GTPase family)
MIEQPLLPGKLYDFKLGTKTVTGKVSTLQHRVDVNTLEKSPAPSLELNEIGRCTVSVEKTVCIDDYEATRSTGAFIVIDRLTNVTVGAGMIV